MKQKKVPIILLYGQRNNNLLVAKCIMYVAKDCRCHTYK